MMTGIGGPAGGPDPSSPPGMPRRPTRSGSRTAAFVILSAAAILAISSSLSASRPGPTPAPPHGGVATASAGRSPDSSTRPSTTMSAVPSASPRPPGSVSRAYLADRSDLLERAELARAGVQPYASALDDLLAWARRAVRRDPRPAERLRIKGTEGPFVDDTAAAYGLALAHAMTGERAYGEAAVRFIMGWVDTTTSTRDTCRDDGACQTSLIISRTVPGFVFAAALLAGTGLMDTASEERFRAWLRDVILPTASELDNNWGDAGTFTRVALTDYLDDRIGFDAAIAKWRNLLDLVEADGHIPLEVARGEAGLGYTQEALDYKVAVAAIAERRGVDLWSYVGAKGGSLKGAVDYLARYMAKPDAWPWSDGVRRRAPSPFWELAYSHWLDDDYPALVIEQRPYGVVGHSAVRWTTLTNGIPLP